MVDICIDEVFPKSKSYPFIAYFQNGYPTDGFEAQKCTVLENKLNNNKKNIASEINDVLYAGDEREETLDKTLMLVRNSETGKVRLIEVGTVELQPIVKSKIQEQELETSYVDLGRKFGSKRHKQIIEQNEKLKLNEDVVMEQLKNVSQNISVDQLDLSSYNKNDVDNFYIPPINREAENLDEVYPITSILTPDQFEQIFLEIDGTDYKPSLVPIVKSFFTDKLSKEKVVLAVYASTLLSMHHKTLREMKLKGFAPCPHSETLSKIVLNEFFTYKINNRLRPAQYKDKALCYAMVLMLLVNNYKIELEPFYKYLKLTEKTVNAKLSMAGAWPMKQGSTKVGVLKIPLNKVSSAFSRRKSVKP